MELLFIIWNFWIGARGRAILSVRDFLLFCNSESREIPTFEFVDFITRVRLAQSPLLPKNGSEKPTAQ